MLKILSSGMSLWLRFSESKSRKKKFKETSIKHEPISDGKKEWKRGYNEWP